MKKNDKTFQKTCVPEKRARLSREGDKADFHLPIPGARTTFAIDCGSRHAYLQQNKHMNVNA